MVVFGSTADPAPHTSPEDLDVAVLFAGAADLLGLVNDLADWLHVEVVVMDLARAGIVARDQALRLAVPLYERERGLFARTQMTAMGMRMDTAWLRRLDLELMAGR
jgi:hypothetical protein